MATTSANKIATSVFDLENGTNSLLVGGTSSGKSTLARELLQHGRFTGERQPAGIYVLAPIESKADWEGIDFPYPTTFKFGVGEVTDCLLAHSRIPEWHILIFDDLMQLLDKTEFRSALTQVFLATSHHRHLWTFFVTHDMFHPHMRVMRRNTQTVYFFDVLQYDSRGTQDFLKRTYGQRGGELVISILDAVLAERHHRWVAVGRRLRGPLARAIWYGGVTPESGGRVVCAELGDSQALSLDPLTTAAPAPGSAAYYGPAPGSHSRPRRHTDLGRDDPRSMPADGGDYDELVDGPGEVPE